MIDIQFIYSVNHRT